MGRIRRLFSRSEGEEGQGLLEMTVGLVFLMGIVLILFEMAMLFYSYIALLNASREGAVYASSHPEVHDPSAAAYARFYEITSAEANAAGLITDTTYFEILDPVIDTSCGSDGTDPLCPITVRVRYEVINPTQGIILPIMGRMGLFQSAWIQAETEMPIR
jgi:Flp pilus assembly protein TadG